MKGGGEGGGKEKEKGIKQRVEGKVSEAHEERTG